MYDPHTPEDSAADVPAEMLVGWAKELDLPEALVGTLCNAYAPVAAYLARRQASLGRCLVVGVNGAQGTGKSTLLWLMVRLLQASHGLRGAGLSLDDLYLTGAERQSLAQRIHPLLRTRGVPGTHDLPLAHAVLDALTSSTDGPCSMPVFDKALDDRAPPEGFVRVERPLQVVILEGWCVGARPQPESALGRPQNQLERTQDRDGIWRGYVNQQLQRGYAELFARLDLLIMLRAPDLACVRAWRIEQEHALSRQLRQQGRLDTTMDDEAVARFVQYFERLTCAMLEEMPPRADVVLELDTRHQISAVRFKDAG